MNYGQAILLLSNRKLSHNGAVKIVLARLLKNKVLTQ